MECDIKKLTNIVASHEEWGQMPDEKANCISIHEEIVSSIQERKSNGKILLENAKTMQHVNKFDTIRASLLKEEYGKSFRNMYVEYIHTDDCMKPLDYIYQKYDSNNIYIGLQIIAIRLVHMIMRM